jgi:hypothetical protein
MTDHNPISVTIDGDQLYANAQLLGVVSINGGENITLDNSGSIINVVQDPSFTSLTVNGDASFGGYLGIGTSSPDNPLNVSNNGYLALSVGDANLPTWDAITTQAKAPTNGTVRIAKNGCWFEGISDDGAGLDYGFIGRVDGGDLHIVNGNNWDNEILIYTLGNGGPIDDDPHGSSSAVIIANYVASSDDRIKHNEATIVNALSAIRQLRPVTYFIRPPTADVNKYNINHNFDVNTNGFPVDTSGNSVPGYFEHGLIAQEVDMIPDFKHCVVHPKNEDDIYKLKYPSIFTHGIAAIQEVDQQQQADQVKIATLESQVATQITQIADLLARVTALESA